MLQMWVLIVLFQYSGDSGIRQIVEAYTTPQACEAAAREAYMVLKNADEWFGVKLGYFDCVQTDAPFRYEDFNREKEDWK